MTEHHHPEAPVHRKASLGRRALKAGGWIAFQMVVTNILRLSSNLIMTRILLPEAFGLIALVSTLVIGFNLLTDIGISRSIMRDSDGGTDRFLRTAWVVKIGRGAMICGAILALALLVFVLGPDLAVPGSVYADPRLSGLLTLSAFVPLMIGLEATTKEVAMRNLNFSRLTVLTIGAQFLSVIAMIGFAQISPTVWALMAGMLVNNLVNLVGSHLFFKGPRMTYIWDKDIADRLWQYGKWLIGSSALTFIARHADKLIFGAYLSATVFGLYSIALIWIEAGRMIITKLLDTVGFPTLSEVIRERPGDLNRIYRKFQRIADLLCIVAFAVTFLAGPWLITYIYEETYHPARQFISLLSLLFLSLRFNPLGGLLMNLGNSRAMMIISAFRAGGLILGLIFSVSFFGLSGGVLAVALAPLASAPYTLARIGPVLGRGAVLQGYLWIAATLCLAGVLYTPLTI